MWAAVPVSYTHLDVYKRQAFGCHVSYLFGADHSIYVLSVEDDNLFSVFVFDGDVINETFED